MRQFDNITVALDKQLATAGVYPSVEVDVIAVSDADLDYWKNLPVTNFYAPGSDRHADPEFLLTFLLGQDQPNHSRIRKDDKKMQALWDKWKERKVMNLVFLSNYPRLGNDQPGNGDRRQIVPLSCERWDQTEALRVSVHQDGLSLETKPLPEQK